MNITRFVFALSTASLAIACQGQPAKGTGNKEPGKPLEAQPPNAPEQKPAFAGQTRAPYQTANVAFDTQVVAKGLEHPWAVAFLPDGAFLVTERPGRLRLVEASGEMSGPIAGVPAVDARDQGGLLDVVLDPAFDKNRTIYFTFAERDGDKNGTALAKATLVREGEGSSPRLDDVTVIWRQTPKLDSTKHFGSRIVFDKTGALLVALGERSIDLGREYVQKLDSTLGKVIRLMPDGSIPKDNPFVGKDGVLPEVYSYGHRNIQAAALHPETGALWVVDHGARGGDEVNVVAPGKNYGWPDVSYGIEYKGDKIRDGITQKAGTEQPIYYWDPVIAPSGMAFYTGTKFPAWRGSVFVGALAGKHVARLALDGTRIVGEERLLADRARIRDVRMGPDGNIYALTDAENGELLRLLPAGDKAPQVGAAKP
jgi:glucose/arabinose dehydrogenase